MDHIPALHPAEAGSDRRQAAPSATTHGCLVVKAAALVTSGEQSLAVWEPLVLQAVQQRYTNERTAKKVMTEASRLLGYLRAWGVSHWDAVTADLVVDWCWTARRSSKTKGAHRRVAQSTARNRQWAARTALREAQTRGAQLDPHELAGVRIKRRSEIESTRPLTDDEAELVRIYADAGHAISRRSLMVALAFAGGTHPEVAAVRMRDLDIEAGAVAFSGEAARIGTLDEWGAETVQRFLRNHPHIDRDELLCTPRSLDPTHIVTVRLGAVMGDAGLKGRPRVSARSIRLTTARKILDSDGIEAAARFLGSPSLDNTATALGHRWRHDSDG